jgi:hypothetical protein
MDFDLEIDRPCLECKALVPVPKELFECTTNLEVICDNCFRTVVAPQQFAKES